MDKCKCASYGVDYSCDICKTELNNRFKFDSKHTPDSGMGIYAISEVCKAGNALWSESEALTRWLNINNGNFEGDHRVAYAVSHCQVVDKPMAFFVVNREFINEMGLVSNRARNKKNFYFPAQAIFNAEILEAPEKLKRTIPKRVPDENSPNGYRIIQEEGYVNNLIYVPDACMSFPHKKPKNVEVYHTVKVKYKTKGRFGFFKSHTEWVEGLKAHIFQHEIDHAHAINIYYKNK